MSAKNPRMLSYRARLAQKKHALGALTQALADAPEGAWIRATFGSLGYVISPKGAARWLAKLTKLAPASFPVAPLVFTLHKTARDAGAYECEATQAAHETFGDGRAKYDAYRAKRDEILNSRAAGMPPQE